MVARCSISVCQNREAEKRGSATSVAPVSKRLMESAQRVGMKQRQRGAQHVAFANVRDCGCREMPHQKYCACGQHTPFDGPVVPDV